MICLPPQVILGLVHAENRWGILPVVKFELIDLYDTSPAVHISESIDSVALHPPTSFGSMTRWSSVSPDSLALLTTFMRNEDEILGPFPFSRLVDASHPTKGGHKRVYVRALLFTISCLEKLKNHQLCNLKSRLQREIWAAQTTSSCHQNRRGRDGG